MSGKPMNEQETALIRQLKDTNTRDMAFHILVKRYQERLYWHIRKIVLGHTDTDDVLQNTFLNAWRGLDSFREESQLFTWLYRIATNEALKLLQEKKKKGMLSQDEKGEYLRDNLSSDEYFSGEEAQEVLQKALITLPDKQRLVFNMKYFDDLKYQEIADILDTSVGALKASYHHAVKKIEEYIKRSDIVKQ